MTIITFLFIFLFPMMVNSSTDSRKADATFLQALQVYRENMKRIQSDPRNRLNVVGELKPPSLMVIYKYLLQQKLWNVTDNIICPNETFTEDVLPGNRSTSPLPVDSNRSNLCQRYIPSQQCDRYTCFTGYDDKVFCETDFRYGQTFWRVYFSVTICVGGKICILPYDGELNSTRLQYHTKCTWHSINIDCRSKTINISSVVNYFNLADISELLMSNCGSIGVGQVRNLSGTIRVKNLTISNNLLEVLPSNLFSNLFNLINLDISSNRLSFLPSSIFHDQTSLEILNLKSNRLSNLSRDIFTKLSALKNLDLSGNNLVSLPVSVFHNQNLLKILDLSFNYLSTLPNDILNQSSVLEVLDLSSNRLLSLHGNIFKHNSHLLVVDLSANELSSVPGDIFDKNSDLLMLDLSSNRISSLPDKTFKYSPWLLACNLSSNILSSLPNNIFKLNARFKIVDLSSNMLSSLTDDIFKYNAEIETLDLSSNRLSSLPDDIFKYNAEIETLNISSNLLSSLPDDIFKYNTLIGILDLSSNLLSFLPDDIFMNNTRMWTVYLSSNKLSSLPHDIFEYNAEIWTLDLSSNMLSSLPHDIFEYNTWIWTLDLSSNKLSSLTHDIFEYNTLIWTLDLSSNKLSSLPHDIFKYNTLIETLDLSSNMLLSLPHDIFENNTEIWTLDLSSNMLSSLPHDIFKYNTEIWTLDLFSNLLSSLPNDIFQNNTRVQTLDLSSNKLSSLLHDIFKYNTWIEILDLSSNMLLSLPHDIFEYNTVILTLDLSSNMFSSLPDDIFKNNTRIRTLDLSSNKLSSLPNDIFEYNTLIQTLDLSSNLLSSLPHDIFKYNIEIETLNISSNLLSSLPHDIFEYNTWIWILDLSSNALFSLPILKHFHSLSKIDLSSNNFVYLPSDLFMNMHLVEVNLSSNKLSTLPEHIFQYNTKLRILDLSSNLLSSSCNMTKLASLTFLNLSENTISNLSVGSFRGLHNLEILDLSHNHLHYIETGTFNSLVNLNRLMLFKNNVLITEGIFQGLDNLKTLLVDSHEICCVQPNSTKRTNGCVVLKDTRSALQCVDRYEVVPLLFGESDFIFITDIEFKKINRSKNCSYSGDAISDCWNLIRMEVLGVFLWIIGMSALLGNLLVLLYRLIIDRDNIWSSHSMFVLNLSISDFLMGVYMLIIASADSDFKGKYVYHEQEWKESILCSSAGILCTISSEMSIFIILAITVDRFIVIVFPLSRRKITWKQAVCVSLICWIVSTLLGIIPQFSFSSYFKGEFYSQSGVCIALPLTASDASGVEYSVNIFIVLNSILFIVILAASIWMYRSMRSSGKASSNQTRKRDIAVAKSLFYVVATDFCCWIPVGVMGTIAQLGGHIPDDVYAWVIVFVLPINSAINPFLYTFTYIWRKRKRTQAQQRRTPNPRRNRRRQEVMESSV